MATFETILASAAARDGAEGLEARLSLPKTAEELRAAADDRYLSLMSLRIFRAGLKHSLVDAKWPAFEEVFAGFEPRRIQAMSDEALEALMGDTRIIRHWGKIKSVRANAAAFRALAGEAGGFGAYLADWPGTDIVGLWADLAKRFTQMGGNSGPYFLRMAGKDSFVLTDAVTRALLHWELLDAEPKGKRGREKAQAAFNRLAEESGRPLCQISMILARSVD